MGSTKTNVSQRHIAILPRYEPDPYSANSNRSLGVARCFDEQTLADKVAWQTIGLPTPVIKILLHQAHDTVDADCKRFAREEGAPVAIVDMRGKVLAYALP
jgi:hypothetical protein